MSFLHNKRRTSVLAVLSVLLGAVGVFAGVVAAHASSFPCNDGQADDHHVEVDNEVYVGVDSGFSTNPNDQQHQHYCVAASGGEGNQSWAKWEVWPASDEGYTADVYGCLSVAVPGCDTYLATTGANADPTTVTNLPGDGNSTSSASAGTGPATCVYVDGAPTCPGGVTIAGVTINEADLIPTVTPYTPTPPCTGINNTCIPVGATVKAGQDASPTVEVKTLGTPTNVDTGPQCVQVNATC